jgi:hypothetical protein
MRNFELVNARRAAARCLLYSVLLHQLTLYMYPAGRSVMRGFAVVAGDGGFCGCFVRVLWAAVPHPIHAVFCQFRSHCHSTVSSTVGVPGDEARRVWGQNVLAFQMAGLDRPPDDRL